MTTPSQTRDQPRHVVLAIARGFLGRCPNCGRGKLLRGYVTPAGDCPECFEGLARYQTADFAPYLVTFAIGLVFIPVAFWLSMSGRRDPSVLLVLLALASALVLLPRMKGVAIALLWALDISANQ
jgi:uncharacterized protein (DUF983 family)